MVRIWSAEISNFKRYSIEREVIWKNCTKRVNIIFSFKQFFTFLLLDLNIWQKIETFSQKLVALLLDKLFKQGA